MLVLILFSVVSFLLAVVFVLATQAISKKVFMDREMNSPFECGFSTKEESRFPFSLRFFLVALIFLIFDVEILLLFPFLGNLMFTPSLLSVFMYFLFLFILSLGLFYEWNNLMLEWT